jgi:tRNA pseudouridine13 synthase
MPDPAHESALPDEWRMLATAPPRAHGAALGTAVIRMQPEDFIVDEELGFAPAGTGPHALLRVRKRGANTDWVARQLADHAGVRVMDVGFAGLKDRHAVTTQWFTVPLERAPADRRVPASWVGFAGDGYEVLEAHTHHRKLPRGALDANRFELRLRNWQGDDAALPARLAAIGAQGVPNYFGPQRFGRGQSNLLPYLSGRKSRLGEYAMSAGRSLVFNAVLAQRVALGNWCTLQVGDLANLDARGSIFPVEAVDDDLRARTASLELHPTGPMWGGGAVATGGAIRALEEEVAARYPTVLEGLANERMSASRRALRIAVRDLTWEKEAADVLRLSFLLRSGGYATAVLRELIDGVSAE